MFKKNGLNFSFSDELEVVFVHTNQKYEIGEKKVNLILSPAFYWCKKEKLGIKSVYSAKKIAHSIFESNIPHGEYKYLVKKSKEDGEFLFFAYDEEQIIKRLTELGIPSSKINHIYFAQTEFENISTPVKISPLSALAVADSIVLIVPLIFAKGAQELDAKDIKLSKKRVNIRKYNSLGVKPAKIYTLSVFGALLAVVLFLENMHYKKQLELLETKNEEMLKNASLPTTTFQLDSIEKSLQKKEKDITDLRDNILKIIEITSDKDITIDEIKISQSAISVAYNTKNIDNLQEKINKTYPKAKQTQVANGVKMEIAR